MRRFTLLLTMVALALAHLLLPWSLLAEARTLDPALARDLLLDLRLPRTLLVIGYGGALGLCGAALQATFANPLASPDVSGASGGAALGAVLALYWLGIDHPLGLAASGMAGAAAALALLMLIAGPRAGAATLLLAGIAISLGTGAATSLALALAPSPYAFYDAFDWLMGSFVDRTPGQAAAALVPAIVASLFLVRSTRALDLLALGEDVAAAMGVRPRRLAIEVVLASAVAVGALVSVCGSIGFVGLVAPVLARGLTGGHPGRAMMPAALIGAAILLMADLLVRSIILPRPIPIGVFTAILGTPFFAWLVIRQRFRSLP